MSLALAPEIKLANLHRALLQMCCFRHTVEFEITLPKHNRTINYYETSGIIAFEIVDKVNFLKTFCAPMPTLFHAGLSSGHFVEDSCFATDMWFAATETERLAILTNHRPWAAKDVAAALRNKGLDAQVRR